MKAAAAIGVIAVALTAAVMAQAQPAPPPPPPLDAAARQAIVGKLGAELREDYADPIVGAHAAEVLTANLKGGAYDGLSDPSQFAGRLNDDLFALAHAEHMHVIVPGTPLPPWSPPRNEFGVVRADRLRGGIGYVEVVSFPAMELFKPAIDRAMTALAGSKALIIDVRRNAGGNSLSEAYLASFVTPTGRAVHIDDLVMRKAGADTFTHQALDSQPTPVSFAGRPVYVLTSRDTFSAGEGLAYNLQSLKLATVVGEVTAAGAELKPGDVNFSFFRSGEPLGSNLAATVPSLRSENPTTKSNWEAQGVRPDIEVPASQALGTVMARLGHPEGTDLASAAQTQVFAPRTTPQAGTEAALLRLLPGLLANTPDYASMACGVAEAVRANQPHGHDLRPEFGPMRSIRFREFDGNGDLYDVIFANATERYGIALTGDGKVCSLGIWPPVKIGTPHSDSPGDGR